MVGSHGIMLNVGYVSRNPSYFMSLNTQLTNHILKTSASWTAVGMYFVKVPAIQWRLYMALEVISPVLLLIGSFWVPESPRWLVYHGREDEGFANLQKLHKQPGDSNDTLAKLEFTQIKQQIEFDRQYEKNWIGLWKTPHIRRRLLTGFMVLFCAQSTGYLVSLVQ